MSDATTPTADTGFAWAVKRSFVGYIRSVPDGRIAVGEGAAITADAEFHFPFSGMSWTEPEETSLQFAGAVAFTAHHGILVVALRRPRLALKDAEGSLLITAANGEVPIARFALPDARTAYNVTMWSDVVPTLTSQGRTVFGDSYDVGEAMAPLMIRIPAAAWTSIQH